MFVEAVVVVGGDGGFVVLVKFTVEFVVLLDPLFEELVNGTGTTTGDDNGVSSMSLAVIFIRVCIPCETDM